MGVERPNEVFDEAAGVDEGCERGSDLAVAGNLRHNGDGSVHGGDAGAAHLAGGLGVHAGDLASHPIAPTDAVEMFQVRRESAAR